mmetsp:Transcript_3253/g.8828  ORF Transcript_3253/g.8828 Transcript_3253/m.8828 type:complete len:397 (-) Transcript_3253:592-1782(-)
MHAVCGGDLEQRPRRHLRGDLQRVPRGDLEQPAWRGVERRLHRMPRRHLRLERGPELLRAVFAVPGRDVERRERLLRRRHLQRLPHGNVELAVRGNLGEHLPELHGGPLQHAGRRQLPGQLHRLPGGHLELGGRRHLHVRVQQLPRRHLEPPGGRSAAGHLPAVLQGLVEFHPRGLLAGLVHQVRARDQERVRGRGVGGRLPLLPGRHLPAHRRRGEPHPVHPLRRGQRQLGAGGRVLRLLPGGHLGRRVRPDGVHPVPGGHLEPPAGRHPGRHVLLVRQPVLCRRGRGCLLRHPRPRLRAAGGRRAGEPQPGTRRRRRGGLRCAARRRDGHGRRRCLRVDLRAPGALRRQLPGGRALGVDREPARPDTPCKRVPLDGGEQHPDGRRQPRAERRRR